MSDVLKHRFTSPKVDSADLTMVQPSHWNDGHKFQGGVHGNVLTRDTGDASFGAKWAASVDTVIYPTSTGTVDNWAPGLAGHTLINWIGAADLTITGIAGGIIGQRVTIRNATNGPIVRLPHVAPTSAAGNQLGNAVSSGPTALGWLGTATYVYGLIGGAGYWLLLDHTQGTVITVPFVAGNYVNQGAVTAAMVKAHYYYLQGRLLTARIAIEGMPGNTAKNDFNVIGWPYTCALEAAGYLPGIGTINGGAWGPLMGSPIVGNTAITLVRFDFANWTAGPHYVYWQASWPVT